MPEGFENCVKNGGHVVTEKLSSTTYRHICYIGKKRYEGEVKTEEGCLSVPAIYEPVTRYERVIVRAQDVQGNFFETEASGLLAVCIQHEMDHLDGKLFVDYLSQMKRQRIRKKMEKYSRETM